MRVEGPGEGSGLLFFLRLNLFKKRRERLRIVPALVHVLHAEVVRFGFEAPTELEERHGQRQTGCFLGSKSANSGGHYDQGDGGKLSQCSTGLLTRDMAGGHVRDFVRHYASHFRFVVGSQDQAGIHVKKTTRQSESIDRVRVDDLDRERNLGIGVPHQVLTQPVDVLRDDGILDQLGTGVDLLCILRAHIDLGCDAIAVSDAPAAADGAVADGLEVVDAAVMLQFYRLVFRIVPGRCRCQAARKQQNRNCQADCGQRFHGNTPLWGQYAYWLDAKSPPKVDLMEWSFANHSVRSVMSPIQSRPEISLLGARSRTRPPSGRS